MKYLIASLFLSLLSFTTAQDLVSALSLYPETSNFRDRVSDFLDALPANLQRNFTLLVPSNTALKTFYDANGRNLSDLPIETRHAYLRYHVLVGELTSAKFSAAAADRGLTVPTLLKDQKYNNRSAGPELTALFGSNADGQVLFIAKDLSATGTGSSKKAKRFRVRQVEAGGQQVRGGLGENATITAVDGVWQYGRFQIVDR
jgi:hypothetical protein